MMHDPIFWKLIMSLVGLAAIGIGAIIMVLWVLHKTGVIKTTTDKEPATAPNPEPSQTSNVRPEVAEALTMYAEAQGRLKAADLHVEAVNRYATAVSTEGYVREQDLENMKLRKKVIAARRKALQDELNLLDTEVKERKSRQPSIGKWFDRNFSFAVLAVFIIAVLTTVAFTR